MPLENTSMSASVHAVVHTPRPWTVTEKYFDEHGEALVQIECESHMIGEIYVCDGAEGEANSRLIAAAPELLEALQEVIDDGLKTNMTEWIVKANAAVKKASG